MHIDVIFDTGGTAIAGVDQQRLVDDIQAELDKLASKSKTEPPKPKRTRPPPGAQGDWASFHWLIDFATDPKMAPIYARGIIYALNSILQSAGFKAAQPKKRQPKRGDESKKIARSKKRKTGESEEQQRTTASADLPIKIAIKNKDFLLPATTAVINEFLKHLGEQ